MADFHIYRHLLPCLHFRTDGKTYFYVQDENMSYISNSLYGGNHVSGVLFQHSSHSGVDDADLQGVCLGVSVNLSHVSTDAMGEGKRGHHEETGDMRALMSLDGFDIFGKPVLISGQMSIPMIPFQCLGTLF